MGFGRGPGEEQPQFVPGSDHELLPLGNADDQVAEAMALSKASNQQMEVGVEELAAEIGRKNVNTALDFLDGLSPYNRERYLAAEASLYGKQRRMVLGRYGRLADTVDVD